MTEPIIINGVDVSECECFINMGSQCGYSNLPDDIMIPNDLNNLNLGCCRNNPNCYYKQLKRKEQELETQKQTNEDCEIEYRRVVTQYNAVIEQNRQLQTELNNFVHIDKGDIFDEYFGK